MKKCIRSLAPILVLILTFTACDAVKDAVGDAVGGVLETSSAGSTLGDTNPDDTNPSAAAVNEGDVITFGGEKWIVLKVESGKALIVSEIVPDNYFFHDTDEAVTWESCSLRAFLNNDFYGMFSAEDQARIVETTLANSDYELSDGTKVPGGNSTADKIFLLSAEEAEEYFKYSSDRKANAADGGEASWWTRSIGDAPNRARYVQTAGMIGGGVGVTGLEGIRPSMWITIN
ncbi:MAG: DUF6273 domain-containing protein [Oscillospiraceae bacterium]|jgi:hypothetical protein|nr:DUF6273 domain-containing protein [Oscillospiraceae bacterium]